MRCIYLSPHPDDAALCAGGLIYDQAHAGNAVEIWTVMSGVPEAETLSDFAREMHAKWSTKGARETVELRRAEDRQAGAVLGAAVVCFDFIDAIYRRSPDGAVLCGDPVGAPIRPEDGRLAAQIARALIPGLRHHDTLVCLLGIGDHVDHVLVRHAAEMLGRELLYIADFPYVLKHPAALGVKAGTLVASLQTVSEAGAGAWVTAVEAYRSQTRSVFEDLEPRSAIRKYWASSGGLRLWTRSGLDSDPKP